ncbi:amidohydrolase family protein [Candidatus Daviesbacteria bacterium]|nr:amidohydrolase family protein [Candidatus Daviesbacteria bacterium]
MPDSSEVEKRIDTHAYLGKSEVIAVLRSTSPYFKRKEHSDTHFLVMPFEARFNTAILRQVSRNPRFLGMYLMFNPNEALQFWTQADRVENIAALMERDYVVGLKSLPSFYRIRMNDPRYFPYYETARQHGMPVLLHAASSGQDFNSAEMTREVLDRFPDLTIILAHFGGLYPEYMAEAVKLAEECPRLYLNTTTMHQIGGSRRVSDAGVRVTIMGSENDTEAMKREAFDIFMGLCKTRPEQILYGSDLGWNPPEESSLWPVDQVSEALAHTIFIDNPRRIFRTHMKMS